MTDYLQLALNGMTSAFFAGIVSWLHERHLHRQLDRIEKRFKRALTKKNQGS